MEQQSAVEWLVSKMPTAFKDLTINKQLIEQAKQMEINNTRYACGLAISKLLYRQAIQESEKNKVAEENNNIDQKDKIHRILKKFKGVIIKVDEAWLVAHDLIDPFSQIPTQLPIHFNSYIVTQLTENLKVDFDIVFQNNQYFALI
jgi:hypothetical protein